jgi:hypothetical protein
MRYSDKTFDIHDAPQYDFVDVMNLATGEVFTYSHTNPLKACALSYLQGDKHDFNTWNYGNMLVSGSMVSITCGGVQHLTEFAETNITVRVGNWSSFKDGRRLSSLRTHAQTK